MVNKLTIRALRCLGVICPLTVKLIHLLFVPRTRKKHLFPDTKYLVLLFNHAIREKLMRAIWRGDWDDGTRQYVLTICFHSTTPRLRAWYLFLQKDTFSVSRGCQTICPWYPSGKEYLLKHPSIDELSETSGVACFVKGSAAFKSGNKEEAQRLFNLARQYGFSA